VSLTRGETFSNCQAAPSGYEYHLTFITFMLPCIGTDFFLISNQTHYLSKSILSLNSTCFGQLLCPSSGVSYCTFGTGKFHAGYDDRFKADSVPSWLLGSGHHNLHDIYQWWMYSRRLL